VLLQVTGMVGSVEYAIAEDRLDEDGELWEPREEDPAAGRESSVPFMVTPYAGGGLMLMVVLLGGVARLRRNGCASAPACCDLVP
jgi:hypothetical protein